ncbi:metallophosphoesterase family protein [Eubacteriales bacterium OttesenSCG-928-A19]|nr:metallophosphoesterase family protein [Eubacteriales bacterium OttesenSCG-928-A19]
MKALILSDIHSNAEALRAIWEAESDCDVIYAAGDYVDYGPQPAEAVDWLTAHGARCVYGNHDQTVIQTWERGLFRDTTDGAVLWAEDNCRRLDQPRMDFLKALPEHLYFELDGARYLMQHRCGEGYATIDSLEAFDAYWDAHAPASSGSGVSGGRTSPRRMIFGHTHRQVVQTFSADAQWLNPGSASYRRPDETSKDAFYMTIEDGEIHFRHVAYDRSPLCVEARSVRARLHPAEWHVAEYFFCKAREDGPMERFNGPLPAHLLR